jgi:hypothetical protein
MVLSQPEAVCGGHWFADVLITWDGATDPLGGPRVRDWAAQTFGQINCGNPDAGIS